MRPLLAWWYEKHFASDGYGCFRGVFSSFSEANRSAPRSKPLGFNHQAYALEFESRLTRVFAFDYPVLFWLVRLLEPGVQVFDYGGHRGTNFYAYARYLTYPADFHWTVCDLPEIVKAGEALARERNCNALSFTTEFDRAADAHILLAAGSIQYIESPRFNESLAALARRPVHLLLNKLPLHNTREFVTLQNGGPAFHPQYVFQRQPFIDSIVSLGYELVDSWEVPTHPGEIPFYPGASFRCHTGLYFRQRP
jgi:putative methyltransferase (TIGR04325 family)